MYLFELRNRQARQRRLTCKGLVALAREQSHTRERSQYGRRCRAVLRVLPRRRRRPRDRRVRRAHETRRHDSNSLQHVAPIALLVSASPEISRLCVCDGVMRERASNEATTATKSKAERRWNTAAHSGLLVLSAVFSLLYCLLHNHSLLLFRSNQSINPRAIQSSLTHSFIRCCWDLANDHRAMIVPTRSNTNARATSTSPASLRP